MEPCCNLRPLWSFSFLHQGISPPITRTDTDTVCLCRSSTGPSKTEGAKPGVKAGGKKVASSPLVSKKLGSTTSQDPAKTRTALNRSNSSARWEIFEKYF